MKMDRFLPSKFLPKTEKISEKNYRFFNRKSMKMESNSVGRFVTIDGVGKGRFSS